MLLWFAGLSILVVWQVFQSPGLDYRMVVLGSVLPLVEVAWGGPTVLHTLMGAVVVLIAVMVATSSRRLLRRRLLGLPIGLFMHLVLDGAWAETKVFWWPFFGWSFGSAGMPELNRGAWSLVMELMGAAAIWYLWRRFGFADPRVRADFRRTGRLPRQVAA